MIEVRSPGSLTTIQDLGRPGWAHLGVPPSGAADRRSLMLANRLVGNAEGAPALETTVRGPQLAFSAAAVVALTGATVEARADRRELAMYAVERVEAGEVLDVGWASAGARTYVAVRGGIAAEAVLGSASSDLLTGLGPPPLCEGDRLELGTAAGDWPATGLAPVAPPSARPRLRLVPGPRDDWFAPEALARLEAERWRVAAGANRVGVRLEGPELPRARDDELASEGLMTGAMEVPPAGAPIVLLADHPTTGGYPVIAVVATEDLPLAGQLRPGDELCFRLARG